MKEQFYQYADELARDLTGDQVLLVNYSGEESDFIRFSRSRVRQPGSVAQRYMSLELIDRRRHVGATVTLAGQADLDRPALADTLARLRRDLPHVPEDPYLMYATEVNGTEQIGEDRLPEAGDVLEAVLAAGRGRDMVGLYAAGSIESGFANSLGQRNWFAGHSFDLQWCFYHERDKAVKAGYAGFEWNADEFDRKVSDAAGQLEVLARGPRTIEPGEYRVYLAPAALKEILDIVAWGGFGLKDHRTKNTSLLKMIADGATLDPAVTLRENTREGLAPNFSRAGFIKPDAVTLIEGGEYRNCLVSPRSAAEYDVPTTGGGESPESLDMSGGDLEADAILQRLDTGVYVNTLWYLNYSDRPAGRITGMTRFATFWVEGGRIAAPLNVMRFDETIYRMLGENLLALTAARDFIPVGETYQCRSTGSVRLGGALIDNFRLTL